MKSRSVRPGGRNLVVTGLPRSGTTLLAALIDSAPRTICLSEPPLPNLAAALIPHAAAPALQEDFEAIRRKLVSGSPIDERRGPEGERTTNYLQRCSDKEPSIAASLQSVIRGPFEKDFTLGLKQPGLFLALLPQLSAAGFECTAIIRNPRDTILSWVNSPYPIAQGGFAPRMWPDMKALQVSQDIPLAERLATIYARCADRVASTSNLRLIRFESLWEDPASVFLRLNLEVGDLGLITKPAVHSPSPLVDEAMHILEGLGGAAAEIYPF